MLTLLTPAHWTQAARDVRAGPYVEGARTTRPWLRLPIFIALGAALIIAAVAGLGALTAFADQAGWIRLDMLEDIESVDTLAEESRFVVLLGVVLFALALAVLGAAMAAYGKGASAFLWPRARNGAWLFLVGFLVMFLVSVMLWPVMYLLNPGETGPLLDPAEPLNDRLIYAGAATVGLLVAAAAEEIAFRGVLLRIVGGLTRHIWLILVINGVLFSAIHWDPDPIAFVARAASGMVWAWAALRLGNLAFAIGAHLANNLFIALLLAPISEAALPGQDLTWHTLALEAVALIAVVIAIERLAQPRPA